MRGMQASRLHQPRTSWVHAMTPAELEAKAEALAGPHMPNCSRENLPPDARCYCGQRDRLALIRATLGEMQEERDREFRDKHVWLGVVNGQREALQRFRRGEISARKLAELFGIEDTVEFSREFTAAADVEHAQDVAQAEARGWAVGIEAALDAIRRAYDRLEGGPAAQERAVLAAVRALLAPDSTPEAK